MRGAWGFIPAPKTLGMVYSNIQGVETDALDVPQVHRDYGARLGKTLFLKEKKENEKNRTNNSWTGAAA